MPSEYVFDRMLYSQQAFDAWRQQNNWMEYEAWMRPRERDWKYFTRKPWLNADWT